jgi:hypothetical protein
MSEAAQKREKRTPSWRELAAVTERVERRVKSRIARIPREEPEEEPNDDESEDKRSGNAPPNRTA